MWTRTERATDAHVSRRAAAVRAGELYLDRLYNLPLRKPAAP